MSDEEPKYMYDKAFHQRISSHFLGPGFSTSKFGMFDKL